MVKKAQFRIQQMVFMIVALMFFFILAGLFFIGYQYKQVKVNFSELEKEQAISFLSVMQSMPEFSYSSKDSRTIGICLDWDKLQIISSKSSDFSELFPVETIKVIKAFSETIKQCPGDNCNYYVIYDSGKKNIQEYETYSCFCKKQSENSVSYDKCELGRLIVGVSDD